ncbi:MAG: hypothetical protein AB2A00_20950 [Myxococcota bacterium]
MISRLSRAVLALGLSWPVTAVAAPARSAESVAVFPLQAKGGADSSMVELMTLTLVDELRRGSTFARVMSPQEVAVLLSDDSQRQLLTCATDRCALLDTEMAGALGVTHMVGGAVFRVDDDHRVELWLLDLRTALQVASVSRQLKVRQAQELLAAASPMVRQLVETSGHARAVGSTAAPSVAPVLRTAGAAAAVVGAVVMALLGPLGPGGVAAEAGVFVTPVVNRYAGTRVPRLRHGSDLETATILGGAVAALVGSAALVLGLALLALGAGLTGASLLVP